MKKELEFSKTERKVGVAELIESKERDNDFVSDFLARWQALPFRCPQKVTPSFPGPGGPATSSRGIKKGHSRPKGSECTFEA